MRVTSLSLSHFRNYERALIEPDAGVTVFTGPNAQGKTNVLEALHLCCLGKSHRTSRDEELIQWGRDSARVTVKTAQRDGTHEVAVVLSRTQRKKKTVRIGLRQAERIGELLGHVCGVLFSPEDLQIVKDGPAERRRFMDMQLSQLRPAYFYALQRAVRTLNQRNALLKDIARNPSLLPTLTEQIPGLFVTGRGIMGYGVSGGAAGQMTLRGVGGGPTTGLLVLIDGHPQYMGLMGHPIADACQSMLADRVEVVRGPASVLYGSNAMGGVINIVTRRMHEDGVKTDLHAGYGSYNTLETEVTNQVRAGRFTSTVTGSYNRTDGHRRNMGFEQYGGYAKLGYRIAQAWDLYADVNLTHFNARNPGSVSEPILDNRQRITRGMTSFTLRNDYGKTSGTLSFFYNWGRHRITDGH